MRVQRTNRFVILTRTMSNVQLITVRRFPEPMFLTAFNDRVVIIFVNRCNPINKTLEDNFRLIKCLTLFDVHKIPNVSGIVYSSVLNNLNLCTFLTLRGLS